MLFECRSTQWCWGMTCLHEYYFRAFQNSKHSLLSLVMTIMIRIGGILVAFLTICFIRHHLSQHHVVACYLLLVACCLLFVFCCLLLVACCLLFVACCLLFVVCCLLFVVCCLLFVVGCLIHSSFNIKPQAHRIERHFHHAALHDLGYLDPIGVEIFQCFFLGLLC